jgi:hypothetical protein
MAGIVSWNFVPEREKLDDDYGWLEWVRWEGIPMAPVQLGSISWVIEIRRNDFSVWPDLDSS